MQYPTHSTDFHKASTEGAFPLALARPAKSRRRSTLLSVAVSAVVIPGLFATMAIPAYAAEPVTTPGQSAAAAPGHRAAEAGAQSYSAGAVTLVVDVQRDAFHATSVATLQHQQAVSQVARVAAARRQVVRRQAVRSASSGASIGSLLANPPYPHFNLASVAAVAAKYQGVPYVFGGESPAGFDCSGLVAYVYAQFGISLPHSSLAQARIGTRISTAAAKPGDVVVMSGGSHIGIYLGGGRMIDAPMPGRVVSERAIYTTDYYIVRFGI
jgi:cell wall-associated NlpC family hydrolase